MSHTTTNTSTTKRMVEEPRKQPERSVNKLGQIETSSINFRIPTTHGAAQHAKEQHGETSVRYAVLKFLHQKKIQTFLMSLLLLDVIILFVEIFLLASYPHCSTIVRDAISCCPAAVTTTTSTSEAATTTTNYDYGGGENTHDNNNDNNHALLLRWLAGDGSGDDDHDDHHHHFYCEAGGEVNMNYEATCDSHKWHRVHTAEEVLFGLTIAILCTFFIELNMAMIALHPTVFFRQMFYLMDYLIVSVSLALEIIFHTFSEDIYQSMAGLLVIIRVWRFVRIGHGFVELTHNMAHEHYNELLIYAEELESLLQQNNITNVPARPATVHHQHSMEEKSNDNTNLLEKIEEERRAKHRYKRYHSDAETSELQNVTDDKNNGSGDTSDEANENIDNTTPTPTPQPPM